MPDGQIIEFARKIGSNLRAFKPQCRAQQIGIALTVAELTTVLQNARERLVITREEERRRIRNDLHDGLARVSEIMGGGFRPGSVIAGFLAADNLRFLSEEEGIHVCQGNIWSQYAVDNQDGEGSICYPYYPSTEHFCKPAESRGDLIDCVNLDGWTVDFLAGRRPGGAESRRNRQYSRMGVGPIETIGNFGPETGLRQMLATTAVHFDTGFDLNGWAWVTNCWEISLVPQVGHLEILTAWTRAIRERWPSAECVLLGDFGQLWREANNTNDDIDLRFQQRGTGIGGSDAEMEIRWFMNQDFRLALLRDWQQNGPEKVIDFTRYDLPAKEPGDTEPAAHARNWSLMNRLNQKGTRPQDKPMSPDQLGAEDRALIESHYPDLFIRGEGG